MTRPFSVVFAALEVALGISFLLSLGFWGEHRSILRAPDGTRAPLVRYLRGFSRWPPSRVRQSSRKLQIGPAIDLLQSVETELADPGGGQLAAGVPELPFDPVDEEPELSRVELAFVGGAVEAPEQLLAVERLAMAVALDHPQRLRDRPLVGGEAVSARGALAAAAKGRAGLGLASLEDGRGGIAAGAVHCVKSSEA